MESWKSSARENLLRSIDNIAPLKKYLRLIKNLDRRLASILFQLCSGHIGLNLHRFHIRRSESPSCLHCCGIVVESVRHFLLDCPQYVRERHELRGKLRCNSGSLSFLLSSPIAVLPLTEICSCYSLQVDSNPSSARIWKTEFTQTPKKMQSYASQPND
jgi:hypothetical protein